jgi:hypothetical protein
VFVMAILPRILFECKFLLVSYFKNGVCATINRIVCENSNTNIPCFRASVS